MKARISALATTAAASGLLFGCAADGSAPNALSAASPVAAIETARASTPATVDNFMLSDTTYIGHELYRTDAKVIVLISHANGCPIVRNLSPALKALKAKYESQGVQFLMINSAIQDSMEAIAKEKADYGVDIPILKDANQLVGEQLGVTRTAEFFVVDPKTWKITYRGPLDDRLDYGTQKAVAEHTWAADAIEATLAGRQAMAASKMSPGCLVDFPERGKVARISYSKQVAPILEQKCAACHTEGGIGPFAMSSYEMVKGFSPMIREVLRTDRMPPWNVDPHVSKFADDKSLTPTEIKDRRPLDRTGRAARRHDRPDGRRRQEARRPGIPVGQARPGPGPADLQRPRGRRGRLSAPDRREPADRGQVGQGLDLCGQPAPGRAPLPVRLPQGHSGRRQG